MDLNGLYFSHTKYRYRYNTTSLIELLITNIILMLDNHTAETALGIHKQINIQMNQNLTDCLIQISITHCGAHCKGNGTVTHCSKSHNHTKHVSYYFG